MSQETKYLEVNSKIRELPPEQIGLISDWYHSFNELYEHRYALFIALCNELCTATNALWFKKVNNKKPWKSLMHSDGTIMDWYFIAGIEKEPGSMITYHLPMSQWGYLYSEELDKAPEWDGHTSEDVLLRLKNL